MQVILFIVSLILSLAVCGGETPRNDAERAQATATEMQMWRIALNAWKLDHHTYPAGDVDAARAAVEPVYINRALTRDAWGNPYRYEATKEGFRLISAGADGKFEPESWSNSGDLTSLSDDAVMTQSGLTRSWKAE